MLVLLRKLLGFVWQFGYEGSKRLAITGTTDLLLFKFYLISKFREWSYNTIGRVYILHMADLDPFFGIPNGPLKIPKSDSRVKSQK